MAKISYKTSKNGSGLSHTARDLTQMTKNKAQSAYSSARDITQSGVDSGWHFIQSLLGAGLALIQYALDYNNKKRRKQINKTARQLAYLQGNIQGRTQPIWSKTKHAVQMGMGTTQDMLTKNTKLARKNLKKAQKNLSKVQGNIGTGLATTQKMWRQAGSQTSARLQQMGSNAKDLRGDIQQRYARHQRKRRRARVLFRLGLLAGVVTALLYAPFSGAEARQRLVERWTQLKRVLGFSA